MGVTEPSVGFRPFTTPGRKKFFNLKLKSKGLCGKFKVANFATNASHK